MTTKLEVAEKALDEARAAHAKTGDAVLVAYELVKKLRTDEFMDAYQATWDKPAVILKPEYSDVSQETHKMGSDYFWKNYECSLNGVNAITRQRLPQLAFSYTDEKRNAMVRQMIVDTLPHMIPYTEDMRDCYNKAPDKEVIGYCLYGILENTLSQYAAIDVYISHDQKVIVTRRSSFRTTYTDPMTLDEGIDYLRRNHYYCDGPSDESDDD